MPTYAERRAHALEVVRKAHTGQVRASGLPVWHHLDRVSESLEIVMGRLGEGDKDEREEISLAALGHDAFEDTDITEDAVREAFGVKGLELIQGMTNRFGDSHPEPYVRQVAAAPETVRLIKLADLNDNTMSVVHALPWLGIPWAEKFFLPIVTPMIIALEGTGFTRYPETAKYLSLQVKTAYTMLKSEIARIKESPPVFAYGTLLDPQVQSRVFGRAINGANDALDGYALGEMEIAGEKFPLAMPDAESSIVGKPLMVTDVELASADEYEGEAYRRIKVTLRSGLEAWVYVAAASDKPAGTP